jgi:hypothetical protein
VLLGAGVLAATRVHLTGIDLGEELDEEPEELDELEAEATALTVGSES